LFFHKLHKYLST